jgi:hypothetical protein
LKEVEEKVSRFSGGAGERQKVRNFVHILYKKIQFCAFPVEILTVSSQKKAKKLLFCDFSPGEGNGAI